MSIGRLCFSRMHFFRRLIAVSILAVGLGSAWGLERVARNPYLGAIIIDAESGRVLFEDRADVRGYPASVTKLMTFFVIMDQVHAGKISLDSPVTVSAEASRTGGSQVYLKQGEVFSVDELLYALMIQSANDAAVALAVHAAGSKEAFVGWMNAKARQLGMTNTTFHSPHGLPPGKGQSVDSATARDLAVLSRELIKHDDILRYSSVKVRTLRGNTATPFEMRNHNHLLGKLAGCDGLKTGYFFAAGYSLAATVERHGRRLIAVVLGSETSKMRDFKTMELIEQVYGSLPAVPDPVVSAKPVVKSEFTAGYPTVKTDKADDQNSTPKDPVITFRVIPPEKKP